MAPNLKLQIQWKQSKALEITPRKKKKKHVNTETLYNTTGESIEDHVVQDLTIFYKNSNTTTKKHPITNKSHSSQPKVIESTLFVRVLSSNMNPLEPVGTNTTRPSTPEASETVPEAETTNAMALDTPNNESLSNELSTSEEAWKDQTRLKKLKGKLSKGKVSRRTTEGSPSNPYSRPIQTDQTERHRLKIPIPSNTQTIALKRALHNKFRTTAELIEVGHKLISSGAYKGVDTSTEKFHAIIEFSSKQEAFKAAGKVLLVKAGENTLNEITIVDTVPERCLMFYCNVPSNETLTTKVIKEAVTATGRAKSTDLESIRFFKIKEFDRYRIDLQFKDKDKMKKFQTEMEKNQLIIYGSKASEMREMKYRKINHEVEEITETTTQNND
jgi:hypothetical protein